MAKKQKENYKEMTDDELRKSLEDKRGLLFKRRLQSRAVPLKNPMVIRLTRRDVARILTQISLRRKGTQNA
jgi:large subunit ribosomal protein L29